ncbi:hypothetical protein [Streptomyces hiroshimensis]|uniref:hypothetical protein n=1 Tax=Streptomyces hiroshimensis TaxID=66424 RepID=UPI0016786881|nr:hypothetical protein [Streptomyces hiroshimensis]
MPDAVEIRVHGVSGTPPADVLQIAELRPVGGDDTARFLRRSEPPVEPPVREAFHWGNMTSGSVSKALWLLLAPFGVLNLARYTLPMLVRTPGDPRTEERRGARRTADAVLRLLGLVLTLLLTAAVAFVAIDLIAFQCGNDMLCTSGNSWLPLSSKQPTSWSWRLPLGAAAPAALIWLLVRFGRQVYVYPPPTAAKPEEWPDGVGALAQKPFWATSPRAPMLRLFHTTAAVALLAMLVAYASVKPVAGLRTAEGWEDDALWAMFGFAAVVGLLCVVLTAVGYHPRGEKLKYDPTGRDAIEIPMPCLILRRSMWAALLAVMVLAVFFGPHATRQATGKEPANLAGFEWAFNALYLACAVLLLALLVTTCLLRGVISTQGLVKGQRPMWGGLACPVLASFAVLLATGFTAGAAIQTARLLGSLVQPEETPPDDEPLLVLPTVFHVTALLWALVVAAAVVSGICVWCFRPGWVRNLRDRVREDYPGTSPTELPDRTVARIAEAWRLAAVKYRLPTVLLVIALTGLVCALLQGYSACESLVLGKDRGFTWIKDALYHRVLLGVKFFGLADDVGAWALTGLAAGLVFLGMRAFRSPQWRRGVGVLWDLLAFWPRLAHPIVPPPYGGRAVLSLTRRIQDKTAEGRTVVLSGHSQGSLICAAAVLQTAALRSAGKPRALDRLALLTHGSQLTWAYARLFPAYAGYPVLRDVYEKLGGRWRNLHRWSDYLGGPVLARPATGRVRPELGAWTALDGAEVMPKPSDKGDLWLRCIGPEIQLRDPYRVVAQDDKPEAPLLKHTAYYADPAYDQVVQELIDSVPGRPSAATRLRTAVARRLRADRRPPGRRPGGSPKGWPGG